jgi:multiple sugar transport system substrate-binding protein
VLTMVLSKKIWLCPALKGPERRISPGNVVNYYVIWEFSENKEGAKEFLKDFTDDFGEAFKASEFYNFPCFPSTVPDMSELLARDPKASPQDKYKVLANVLDWTTNVGFPGYSTNAINEVVSTFVLNTMFAKVARDELSAEDAVLVAEKEIQRIFDRWK